MSGTRRLLCSRPQANLSVMDVLSKYQNDCHFGSSLKGDHVVVGCVYFTCEEEPALWLRGIEQRRGSLDPGDDPGLTPLSWSVRQGSRWLPLGPPHGLPALYLGSAIAQTLQSCPFGAGPGVSAGRSPPPEGLRRPVGAGNAAVRTRVAEPAPTALLACPVLKTRDC